MKRVFAVVSVVMVAACLRAGTITGQVTSVADGDSFVIVDAAKRSYRVRVQGIDAPERSQPFSNAARSSLRALLSGREVTVVKLKSDQYGRVVAHVYADGRNVALEQLRTGMVWFYTHYGNEMNANDRAAYLEAQRSAKAAKRGLWADAEPVPPWQYRRKQR